MKANISNLQKIYSEIPGTWEFEGVTYQGYEHFTDLHFAHGWRDVVIPEITQFQILENDYILLDDIITKLVIDLTPEEIAEEIAEANKIIIQQNIENIKQQQFKELSKTDWYITRFIETGIEIPEEILEERKQIRLRYE